MKKRFELIHVNAHMYMVTDSVTDHFINKSMTYRGIGPYRLIEIKKCNPNENEVIISTEKLYHLPKDCFGILATTDPSLGIPLLPGFEDFYSLESAKTYAQIKLKFDKLEPQGIIDPATLINLTNTCVETGYKFASLLADKTKWNNDSLRAAFEAGVESKTHENGVVYATSDDYIKSLQTKKIPVAVDVDGAEFSWWHSNKNMHGRIIHFTPVLSKDNKINVVKWIY